MSSSNIQEIFQAQKSNLQNLRNQSVKQRKDLLKKLHKAIFTHREAIQKAVFLDFKKPAIETDVSEIYPTISELKHTLSHLAEWAQNESVETPLTLMGSSSYVQYEPKGNVLIITPWNYPIYLTFSPIISAIAAGNAVILKPSEFTPNINKEITNILKAGPMEQQQQ